MQMEKLTSDLIRLSLCDRQNFPCMRKLGRGFHEVGIGDRDNLSYALKNVPYHEVYKELDRAQAYNLRMLDGALVHMMYRFRNNVVEAHRLGFFPSPFLEEFQNSPEAYLEDEIYAEVTRKNIVPFPIRFDYDCREEVVIELDHPKSHLTLGQYQNCRIPVSAPLTPCHFITFILRNFYNTAYLKYCSGLTRFCDFFDACISTKEKSVLYVQIPES